MSYLPADVQASLMALQLHLDRLKESLDSLQTSTHISGIDTAKVDLTAAYLQYVLLYVCKRLEGDDSCFGQVCDGVKKVKEHADLLQKVMKSKYGPAIKSSTSLKDIETYSRDTNWKSTLEHS